MKTMKKRIKKMEKTRKGAVLGGKKADFRTVGQFRTVFLYLLYARALKVITYITVLNYPTVLNWSLSSTGLCPAEKAENTRKRRIRESGEYEKRGLYDTPSISQGTVLLTEADHQKGGEASR